MRQHTGIAHRFFGNDIDCSGNSRRAEQSRSASTHHFHTFYHAGRNLLDAIHTGQCTKNGTGIEQDLRIRTIQSIDAHLLEAAILTIRLYTDTRLKTQSLCQSRRIGILKDFQVHHIHQCRSQATGSLVTIGRYYYAIQSNCIFFYLEIFFQCAPFLQRHIPSDGFIPHRTNFEHKIAFGKILQEIMPGSIGYRSDGSTFQGDCYIGQVFFGVFIKNMANDIGV